MAAIRKAPANQQQRNPATAASFADSSDEGFIGNSSDDLTMSTSSSGSPGLSAASSQQAVDDLKTNLIVNYLPQGYDLESLKNLFEAKGPIESVKLIRDKVTNQSLGYAFVNFATEEGATKAVNELNGLKLQNKVIKVSHARKSSEAIKGANLYVSGFPKRWGARDLEKYFFQYGDVITARVLQDNTTGLSKGVGFVRFDQKCQAEEAIQGLNGMIPAGCTEPIQVKYANNPSAAATAMQAAAAAAAACSAGSPTLNGRFNFATPVYPAMSGGFMPALAAFMQNGGLAAQTGLGLNPFVLAAAQPQMAPQAMSSVVTGSGHRSRNSPVGPILHQAPRTMRYSPMSPLGSGDLLSASGLFGMAGGIPYSNTGAGSIGQQSGLPVLFIYNLQSETDEAQLWDLFNRCGCNVNAVKIVRDQVTQKGKGYAFVTVNSGGDAQLAIATLNGVMLGNRVLQVSLKDSNTSRYRK